MRNFPVDQRSGAPALRVCPRRLIGASGLASGSPGGHDPLVVVVAASGLAKIVAESRVVLSEMSRGRDSAAAVAEALTTACVDYSTAGGQAGLNGARGWQVVDSQRVLHFFTHLLISLIENAWGPGDGWR